MTDQKKGWDLGVVLALVAVLISICTMIISLVETSIMKKQQQSMTESAKASVWPYVTTQMTTGMNNGEIDFNLVIENKGVGPALINNLDVFYNGEPMEGTAVSYVLKHCPDAIATNVYANNSSKSVLSPGEVKQVLGFSFKNIDFLKFADFTSSISSEYCYSNIYGDAWVSSEDGPVESKSCK